MTGWRSWLAWRCPYCERRAARLGLSYREVHRQVHGRKAAVSLLARLGKRAA